MICCVVHFFLSPDVDDLLAQHIAHLFIRDPLYLLSEKIHQDDSKETDHFENIQSTNWQTLRFKPPPPNSNIGWRVEFRPMEVQLSDFENAAYVVFIVLVTRVILTFKLNFLIPISKVDENMVTAQKKDAVTEEKFYFRKDVITGKLMTMAQWIRKFVLTHADYKQDSVVNENITYDLLVECEKIASGEKPCPELFFKKKRDSSPSVFLLFLSFLSFPFSFCISSSFLIFLFFFFTLCCIFCPLLSFLLFHLFIFYSFL
ncbi:GCLC [Acanthosepion pharaonis]|uniref:Glutamate--cysteine ligase n=1 Tax=Acanthosepion pharaonis TaxID=158019 RepID=A0A812BKJ1_ACAPH|nr:GCLC [Sepia pharaonis]